MPCKLPMHMIASFNVIILGGLYDVIVQFLLNDQYRDCILKTNICTLRAFWDSEMYIGCLAHAIVA